MKPDCGPAVRCKHGAYRDPQNLTGLSCAICQPSTSDLYHKINGLTPKSPEDRAEFVVKVMLDGLTVCDQNREQVKEFLARHFRYLQEAQPSASDREGAEQEQRWQPIETAPKDQMILVVGQSNTIRIVRFNEQTEQWHSIPGNLWRLRPTHWMPLPEPPHD